MSQLDAHLDVSESILYVTEAKYTGGGSLQRRQWPDKETADAKFKFLTERASTDYVRLFEVRIERTWSLLKDTQVS